MVLVGFANFFLDTGMELRAAGLVFDHVVISRCTLIDCGDRIVIIVH